MRDLSHIRVLLAEESIHDLAYYLKFGPDDPEGVPYEEALGYILEELSKNPMHFGAFFSALNSFRFITRESK
jgi:hypothetical protein